MDTDQGALRIRPGMDVFSAYQDEYIGTVVKVLSTASGGKSAGERGATARESQSSDEAARDNPHLVPEQGPAVSPNEYEGGRRLGEEMGPFPTMAAGNVGPKNQSAGSEYGTKQTDDGSNVVSFALRPGRINLGPLSRLLYIPISAIHSISMERVILGVQKADIPSRWRDRYEARAFR